MDQDADPIRPICTEADYQAALALVAPYFEAEPDPDITAGFHFDAMVWLIEAYAGITKFYCG